MQVKSVPRELFGIIVLLLIGLASPAVSQQAEPAPPVPPYISMDEVTASPGASLMVPLYYTSDAKMPLRSFRVEIEYVSNNLLFQDAVPGTVDPERLKLTHSLTKGEPDAKGVSRSKLRVSASLLDEKPNAGLGEGLLAYLMFNLSIEAKPFVIKLIPTVISASAEAGDPKEPDGKVPRLGAQPGSVVVLSLDATPEMSCFFFTH